MNPECRQQLLTIYRAALDAVQGAASVRGYLRVHPIDRPVHLIAVGKAAASMTLGAMDACGADVVRGLVVTKDGYLDPGLDRYGVLRCMEAGHPLPDARSLAAGAALLDFIDTTPTDHQLLFLISGGASALVEHLPEGIDLDDLHRVNQWLLGSGMAIGDINAVRKALSCIKGGRLSARLGGRRALALAISDVRGDDPATIGSGLLVPARHAVDLTGLGLPPWLSDLIGRAAPAGTAAVKIEIVANLDVAMAAAADFARGLGYAVHRHPEFMHGDAVACGRQLAARLGDGAPGVHVWGGETTVRLPASPGRGGRCQSLALAAAIVCAGRTDVMLLAAGTDGSDGPTEDAGALVDGGTLQRGGLAGLDAEACLSRADAGTFLEAAGDLLQTGPTGSNVMDLVIGIKAG